MLKRTQVKEPSVETPNSQGRNLPLRRNGRGPRCRRPGEGCYGYVPPCRPSTRGRQPLPGPFASSLRSRSCWPLPSALLRSMATHNGQARKLPGRFLYPRLHGQKKTWGRFRVSLVGGCPHYHAAVPFSPRFNLPSAPPAELQNSLARPFDPSVDIPFTPASGSCLLLDPMHIPQPKPTPKLTSASASCRARC